MYSGGSGLSIDIHFVVIELSYDVLSPLPIVLSKHFNHPHPYIEIATAISDISQCSGGMQEWVIQIPSIPILVSVLFPSLHLKYFRIKFLLLVCIVFMRMRTKPHPHPVIS